jgi:transposase
MRKEINGLAAIVELSFKLDPFGKAVFVFCNRSLDRLKILEWDGDGFWLHLKRLGKGRFKWPSKDKDGTMSLSGEELEHFLEGTKLVRKLLRQEAIGRAAV